LKPKELDAIHEILVWGRQSLNNKILEAGYSNRSFRSVALPALAENASQFYGNELERFDSACRRLGERIRSVLPQGRHRARIRATSRETRQPKDGTLAETLGEESAGLVVVDPDGHPLKYNQMDVYESIVAKQSVRIEVDVPGEGGRGWRRAASTFEMDAQADLDDKWKEDLAGGARHMLQETWAQSLTRFNLWTPPCQLASMCKTKVKANDPHYDAKCFPCVHPWGTGSLLAEPGSGSPARYVRNRATNLESFFRRTAHRISPPCPRPSISVFLQPTR
jgi:hypothetical protein